MKLLALYVEHYRQLFENVLFNFSENKTVTYVDKRLSITQKIKYYNFYGPVLKNVNAVVGENGSGKTSLLNLLGYSQKERIETTLMEEGEIRDKYFLVYEMDETNCYFIERYGRFQFDNIEGSETQGSGDGLNSSLVGSFSFKRDNDSFKKVTVSDNLNASIFYLSGKKQACSLGLIEYMNQDKADFLFRNKEVKALQEWYCSYVDLCKNKIVESEEIKILVENKKLLQSKTDFRIRESDNEVNFHFKSGIFEYDETFNDMISNHLSMLADRILHMLGSSKKNHEVYNFYIEYDQEIIEWNTEKLYSFFKQLNILLDKNDKQMAPDLKKYCMEIVQKSADFYQNLYDIRKKVIPEVTGFIFEVSGRQIEQEKMKLCQTFDELKESLVKSEQIMGKTDLSDLIPNIHFLISSGEEKIISLISYIFNEVNSRLKTICLGDMAVKKNYIIIVDDIEKELHLEWSRNLIDSLITYLNNRKFNMGYKDYTLQDLNITIQLIFSTHSPFMLSDLHSSSVLKLKKRNGTTICETGEKVFAQNIHRILNQEFFIKSNYGAYSEKRIGEIIHWLREKKPVTKTQTKEYGEIIKEIGEPILRQKLHGMYRDKIKDIDMEHKAEARAMSIFEYDQERHMQQEREAGIEKGERQLLRRQVQKKLAKGMNIADIAEALEETEERIREIAAEVAGEQKK